MFGPESRVHPTEFLQLYAWQAILRLLLHDNTLNPTRQTVPAEIRTPNHTQGAKDGPKPKNMNQPEVRNPYSKFRP